MTKAKKHPIELELEQALKEEQKKFVLSLLKKIAKSIVMQRQWIKARQDQIQELQEIKQQLLDCYDKGELTEERQKALSDLLQQHATKENPYASHR